MSEHQEHLDSSCPEAMSTDAMADEIARLRRENAALRAAVERVRAACENDLRWVKAQPILRALEETP